VNSQNLNHRFFFNALRKGEGERTIRTLEVAGLTLNPGPWTQDQLQNLSFFAGHLLQVPEPPLQNFTCQQSFPTLQFRHTFSHPHVDCQASDLIWITPFVAGGPLKHSWPCLQNMTSPAQPLWATFGSIFSLSRSADLQFWLLTNFFFFGHSFILHVPGFQIAKVSSQNWWSALLISGI